jgi:ferredoxin-type protein NapH
VKLEWPTPLQVTRRSLQMLVVALTLFTPILARYANYTSARQLDRAIERTQGSLQGGLLATTDSALRAAVGIDGPTGEIRAEERERLLLAARGMRGSTWSFELFGITLTDPLAVLESILASRSVKWVLIAGLLIPLLGTLLLGRVFCSWICPAGFLLEVTGKLRKLARWLELKPGNAKLWAGNKYVLLALGLALSFVIGLPVLGYAYPPALIAREAHNGLTLMFDRAEDGLLGFSAAGLTLASWFLLAICAVELAFGSRLWCRSLCPGGALYALLGARRLVRVEREPDNCTHCGECVVACEMGLSPMTDFTGSECDNCGKCVAHCGDDALHFRRARFAGGPRKAVKA